MHPNVRAWLDQKLTVDGKQVPLVERLAELIHVNGSLAVGGYGFHSFGGIYGRTGLDITEAHELMELSGFLRGFEIVVPGINKEIRDEVTRIWKDREARSVEAR